MDEEDTSANGSAHPSAPAMDVDMELVDSLPGGRVVMPLERQGKFVWLVVKDHISDQAREEMVASLRHIVVSGLWQQNWQPPQGE